ncbi:hypothetical protein F53441_3330 [Fusarium austroafricanum]|uniref:BRCT domain-containing protein n=1 Tax=Fusarium austroafricanum TaxID=2364996 RepID=A0A8H4KRT7_9HYPO|nr:hypothetical protein F53441_3330 [Fusarium austroafricanum]
MPAQIFKGRVLAAAGPLPGQLTADNLKKWTSLRKGIFIDDVDDSVTHLLCTKEQFDKKVPKIRQALKLGKGMHIIHCDWFEFSAARNKKLPEADFSMRNIIAKENAIKREKARIEKGKRDAEKFVNTNHFHLYRDRLNFVYQVDITRDDEFAGEFGQKYSLCLWESNAKPHLYRFTAKFLKQKGSSQPLYHRPSPHEGKWRAEMNLFMEFFRKKTGIDWEDRVSLAQTMPSSYFQYKAPSTGKPVGRRLRHDIDYCREINAEIRGLSWPPVEEENKTDSAEDESDAGPRAFEEDEEAIASPPNSEHVPQEGLDAKLKISGGNKEMTSPPASEQFHNNASVAAPKAESSHESENHPQENTMSVVSMQANATETHGNKPERELKTLPEEMEVEPESTIATPALPVHENHVLEAAPEGNATKPGDVEKMGISLEFETREPF